MILLRFQVIASLLSILMPSVVSQTEQLGGFDWAGMAFDELSVEKLTDTSVKDIRDFTSKLRETEALQEFGDAANNLLQKANIQEWKRALDEPAKSFPYIVCKETLDSGYKTAQKLSNLLKRHGGTDETIEIEPILNINDLYCAILLTPGAVALQAGLEDSTFTFQPYLQSLKLIKKTWDTLQAFVSDASLAASIDFELCPSTVRDLNSTTTPITDDALVMLNNVTLLKEIIIFWDEDDVDVPNRDFWERLFYQLEDGFCFKTIEENLKWEYSFGQLSLTIEENTQTDSLCSVVIVAAVVVSPEICSAVVRQPLKTRNKRAQWMVQSGIEEERPMHDFGILGEGQVIAVSDTGLDTENCYFRDSLEQVGFNGPNPDHRKIWEYKPHPGDRDDYQYGHGTHVVGSIVGSQENADHPNDGMVPGMAPKAKVAFMDMGIDDILSGASTSAFTRMGRPFAKVHSASWGDSPYNDSPYNTDYTLQAKEFDKYMYENDDFLMIFAGGNAGYGDGGGTIGPPATCKNCISVGASHSYGNGLKGGIFGQLGPNYLADFSSRGPTADGRNKPDLVAPGKYILSAGAQPLSPGSCDPRNEPSAGKANGGVVSMAGTSMATPVTAGHAALIRQYFEQGFYQNYFPEHNPMPPLDNLEISGALVKAVLMNGAQYLEGVGGGDGPQDVEPYDFNQNFGRISIIDSVYLPGKSNRQIQVWDRQTIFNAGLQQFEVSIDQSAGCTSKILSVTLVWMDKPGYPYCRDSCLVNNLDLSLQREGSDVRYFPNGRDSPDVKNNAERIQIFDAIDGQKFVITVQAENLAERSQQYALVATGCFGGVAQTLDTSQNIFDNDNSKQKRISLIIGLIFGGVCLVVLFFAGPVVLRKCKARRAAKRREQQQKEEQLKAERDEEIVAQEAQKTNQDQSFQEQNEELVMQQGHKGDTELDLEKEKDQHSAEPELDLGEQANSTEPELDLGEQGNASEPEVNLSETVSAVAGDEKTENENGTAFAAQPESDRDETALSSEQVTLDDQVAAILDESDEVDTVDTEMQSEADTQTSESNPIEANDDAPEEKGVVGGVAVNLHNTDMVSEDDKEDEPASILPAKYMM